MVKEESTELEVYTYSVGVNIDMRVSVKTKVGAFDSDEFKVQKAHFSKEKIEELKKVIIEKIQNSENPFDIYCVDRDVLDFTHDVSGEIFDEDNPEYRPSNIWFCD